MATSRGDLPAGQVRFAPARVSMFGLTTTHGHASVAMAPAPGGSLYSIVTNASNGLNAVRQRSENGDFPTGQGLKRGAAVGAETRLFVPSGCLSQIFAATLSAVRAVCARKRHGWRGERLANSRPGRR